MLCAGCTEEYASGEEKIAGDAALYTLQLVHKLRLEGLGKLSLHGDLAVLVATTCG